MRKQVQMFLCLVLITTLFGCTPTNQEEQPEVTTTAVTTTSPITTISEEEKQAQEFQQYNVLDFSVSDESFPFESNWYYVRIHVKNNSSETLILEKVVSEAGEHADEVHISPRENRVLLPNEEKEYVQRLDKDSKRMVLEKVWVSSYSYILNEELVELALKSERVFKSNYTKHKREESKGTYPVTPYIPNHGITIFTWEEYGQRVFDYLPGLEREVCPKTTVENVWQANSLYDELNVYDENALIYLRGVEKLSNEALKEADRVLKYKGIEYVTDLNDSKLKDYEYVKEYIVYSNKEGKCPYKYCAEWVYSVEFSFTSENLSKVGNRKLNENDIKKLVNENENLDFHIRGLYEPLTDDLISKYRKMFDYNVSVEGEIIHGADKPIIYLYPEEEMDIHVSLSHNGKLNTTYPLYNNGWNVRAKSDGTLYNYADGQEYSYLFWEGEVPVHYDMSKGFVVAKEDSITFLQEKLSYLGLTPKEYNEFIVYWLPYLNQHSYNLITFQEESYTSVWKLNIDPQPDSIQRVFMVFKGLDEKINIPEQKLTPWQRNGYSVVEWGGVEIK